MNLINLDAEMTVDSVCINFLRLFILSIIWGVMFINS